MKFLNVATEAIGFQSPELADKMTALIELIMESKSGKEADSCQANKDLIDLLKTSTGLNIKLDWSSEYAPCCLPFRINPSTILETEVTEWLAEDSRKMMRRLKECKERSFIDLKNAKVSGLFSIPELPIYFWFKYAEYMKFTAREIAAILAHEVGHLFVGFEMAFRTVRTNQILAAIAKSDANADKDTYDYILKTTEDIIGLKTGTLDELVEIKDKKVVTTVVLGEIDKKNRQDAVLGLTAYDSVNFESLADNFAARLGLGKELVLALEKMTKKWGGYEFNPTARIQATIFDIVSISLVLVSAVSGFGMVVAATAALAESLMYISVISFFIGSSGILKGWSISTWQKFSSYDDLTTRFKRIKEQLVQYLKNTKLPMTEVKTTLNSIAKIEQVIGEISEYKGIIPAIFNFFSSVARNRFKAVEVQSMLESLASNALYIKAAEIKTL